MLLLFLLHCMYHVKLLPMSRSSAALLCHRSSEPMDVRLGISCNQSHRSRYNAPEDRFLNSLWHTFEQANNTQIELTAAEAVFPRVR